MGAKVAPGVGSSAEFTMGRAIAAAFSGALHPQPWMPAALTRFFQDFARAMFDPYRPELHYMRGPGPKWREKHGKPQ
jgi:hypothetical protein